MRFIYCVLLSTLFLACTPQPPHAGEENYPCRTGFTWAGACNDDLRCVDGTCVACGDLGETCCAIAGGDQHVCNSGVACDDFVDAYGTCTDTCGSPGLACCDYDTCPNGGDCIDGTCSGTPNPPNTDCLNGPEKHVMYVIFADCSFQEIIFYVNNLAEAEACRDEYVAAAAGNEEVCPLDVQPDLTDVCSNHSINGNSGYQFWNCSAAQVNNCEQFWCSDCTWSTGSCP
jgi:hypothetical protein